MLYNIIIAPIETIIDWVFLFVSRKFSSLGIMTAVAGVSIAMNFMALPIYNVADALQEKERKISKALEARVKRIKKAFKGDEQFMMLQAYYRENNYHPLYVLRSSLSILIELPFFIAAYHYLSNCEALSGASFWIFKNLGAPDNLFSIHLGSTLFYINILPIIMTVINFVSGAIYTKEAPAREKVQLYVVAGIFLVLLYNSPSGLVIYWILNNLFSLVKNIVIKMKNPGRIVHIFISLILIAATLFYLLYKPETSTWKKALMIFITLIFLVIPYIKAKFENKNIVQKIKNDSINTNGLFPTFFLTSLSIVLLFGLLLPSSLISSSPAEFSYLGTTDSPISYLWSSFFIIFGLFMFWPTVIYYMFGTKVKYYESIIFFAILICSLLNAYVFKADYGTIDPLFTIDKNLLLVPKYYFILPIIIFFLAIVLFIFSQKSKKKFILSFALLSLCIAEFALGAYKTHTIKKEFKKIAEVHEEKNEVTSSNGKLLEPIYHLSKTEKNVVVLFLDRAISSFFPYIIEQFPEMENQFSGFTFYPNTLSFGNHTVFGFPEIIGGYEYTQLEFNKRNNELLKDKHNEALLVMPKIFADAGYDVTYTDPSTPNYEWSGDFSAFEPYPEIKVSEIKGNYSKLYKAEFNIGEETKIDEICRKQMIYFYILEGMYPLLRRTFHNVVSSSAVDEQGFIDDFSTLYYLKDITVFDNDKPTFAFIENETPHRPIPLNAPEYNKPAPLSTNSTGSYPNINSLDLQDYHVNAASLKQVVKYLDFLKDNDVYDNTRIIIVADHGYYNHYSTFDNFKNPTIPSGFNPLFLVKDFNASGKVKTDNSFMTNADTLFFAKEGLGLSDVNPFTGKLLTQEKDSVEVWLPYNEEWNVTNLKGKTQFTLKQGWKVKDDIFNPDNWEAITYDEYLKQSGGTK